MTDGAPGNLTVDIQTRGSTTVIEPRGELDIATVGQMVDALDALDADTVEIVIDLRGLSFLDSSGLRSLLVARRRADEMGQTLTMIRGSGPVEDILQLTGLDQTLPLVTADAFDDDGKGTPIG